MMKLFQNLFLCLSLESQMYSGLGGIPGSLPLSERQYCENDEEDDGHDNHDDIDYDNYDDE